MEDIVIRLKELTEWQREIVEGKREMVKWEQLRLNDVRRNKRLLQIWWAERHG